MRCNVLAKISGSIPYIKELRPIFGSPTGCILGKQLDYWFDKYPDGFYKFLSPAPKHDDYTEGDSWTEETGFSKDEFRSAFKSAGGICYKSVTQYNAVDNPFLLPDGSETNYCSVHNRITGHTHYYRNHEKVDRELEDLFMTKPKNPKQKTEKSRFTEIDNPNPRKSTIPTPVNRQSQYRSYSENTAETTTESKAENPPACLGNSDPDLSPKTNELSIQLRQQGVDEFTAEQLAMTFPKRVKQQLEWLPLRKISKSPAAYLIGAIRGDYKPPTKAEKPKEAPPDTSKMKPGEIKALEAMQRVEARKAAEAQAYLDRRKTTIEVTPHAV